MKGRVKGTWVFTTIPIILLVLVIGLVAVPSIPTIKQFFGNVQILDTTWKFEQAQYNNLVAVIPLLDNDNDNHLLEEQRFAWNVWIQKAQYSRNTYGKFSTYPVEVLDLRPFEVGGSYVP